MGSVGEQRRNDPRRRLTVAQAAAQLGISVDAMRARVKRETVDIRREGGRVYVLLDAAQDTDQDAPRVGESSALISQLREEIAYLRDENRRKDELLAAALSRIPPAIEAPQEATDAAEPVEQEPERDPPRPASLGAQEGAGRRLWRRVFGG
jgi:hypothetical protein